MSVRQSTGHMCATFLQCQDKKPQSNLTILIKLIDWLSEELKHKSHRLVENGIIKQNTKRIAIVGYTGKSTKDMMQVKYC